MMSASTPRSISGHQTVAPVALRDRRDRADVVEVRMREQDRLEFQPELLDHPDELVGLVAGVEDDRLVRAVATRDERVLLHRPDGEHADVHQSCPLPVHAAAGR